MAAPVVQRSSVASFHRVSSSTSSHRLSNQRSLSLHYEREGSGSYLANGIENGLELDVAAPTALELFEQDSIFSKFLLNNFNAAEFASEALSSESAAAASEKLEEGIHLLEKQLRSEVFLRHDGLLQQLSTLKETESVLAVVRAGVESLQGSVQRVRSEIADPYKQIKLKSRQLTSLHETVELLRSIIKSLKHVKKLKEVMESGAAKADLAKAAEIFNDIETLRKEADLSGVEVLDSELPWLSEVGSKIRVEAMKGLESGMEGLSQAEVGSALQVYYNMGELKSIVEVLISKYKSQVFRSVGFALDMKAISVSVGGNSVPGGIQRSGTPQLGGSIRAREGLWQRLATCMEQLRAIMLAVWHLQRVLSKKRDPISHTVFLEEIMQVGDITLTERVWEALVKSFSTQMKSAFTASSFVKETFVHGYPKLLGMVDSLLEGLVRDTDVRGVLPPIDSKDTKQLVAALEPFQTAYLGKCLTRLLELVNNMFPTGVRGSIPTQEHIARLIARIQEEIETCKTDDRLTLLILREVGKVLQLLAEKSTYQISAGPESRQVSGPANPVQLKIFTLCLYLQEVHNRVTTMLTGLPPVASEALSASLGSVHGVAVDSIAPLFKAMAEKLESCILQMHDQNFGSEGADTDAEDGSSRCMEDLEKSILHFRSEFLSKLMIPSSSASPSGAEAVCSSLARKLASRVLLFFVRHCSLVRPLSESGKLRMAKDMAELELMVGQGLYPVEQLGASYSALRAFRPLIFLETSEIAMYPLLQDLPLSVILHHLYSRAPVDLESPMRKSRLSPQQYSLWMDTQGEEQVWKGVKLTLDEYAAKVRARGDREFTPVYPLMLQLGSSLTENGRVPKSS